MAVRLIEDFEEYKKNPKLHIKRSNGRVYEYITSSAPVGSEYGDGVEYFDPDKWWVSYIVTNDGKLLSWDLQGKYYLCGDDVEWWVE